MASASNAPLPLVLPDPVRPKMATPPFKRSRRVNKSSRFQRNNAWSRKLFGLVFFAFFQNMVNPRSWLGLLAGDSSSLPDSCFSHRNLPHVPFSNAGTEAIGSPSLSDFLSASARAATSASAVA